MGIISTAIPIAFLRVTLGEMNVTDIGPLLKLAVAYKSLTHKVTGYCTALDRQVHPCRYVRTMQ